MDALPKQKSRTRLLLFALPVIWLLFLLLSTQNAGYSIKKISPRSTCFQVTQKFSWSALSTVTEIKKLCSSPASLHLPIIGQHEAGKLSRLRYKSEGLQAPTVGFSRTTSHAEDPLPQKSQLQGTSPGFVSILLPIPTSASEAKGKFNLDLSFGVEPGSIELAPLQLLRTAKTTDAFQNGFIYSLLFQLDSSLLLLVLVAFLARAVIPKQKILAALALSCWIGAALSSITSSALIKILSAPLLAILFGIELAWEWLFVLPGLNRLPKPVELSGEFAAQIQKLFEFLSPSGYLMRGGHIENLAGYTSALEPLSRIGHPFLLSLGVTAAIIPALLRARRAEIPTVALAALILLNFLIYPVYQLPISPTLHFLLGLLVIVMTVGFLLILTHLQNPSEEKVSTLCINRNEWMLLAALLSGYCLVHLQTLRLPVTWNSDELDIGFWLLSSLLAFLAPLSKAALAAAIAALIVLLISLWRWRPQLFSSQKIFLLLAASILALTITMPLRPATSLSPFQLYRYAPFSKIVYAILGIFFDGTTLIDKVRAYNIVIGTFASGAVFLAARQLGFGLPACICAALSYGGSFLIYYWSSFAYSTIFMALLTNIAAALFLAWLRSGSTAMLQWCGVFLAMSFMTRETAISSIAVMLAISFIVLCLWNRSRENMKTWGWIALATVMPVFLWQKLLVGSWYEWVGRDYAASNFLFLLTQSDRWRLMPWHFYYSNGPWFYGLALIGSVVMLTRKELRLGGVTLLLLFLADYFFPMGLARMREYDGHSRFLVPLMLPASLFIAAFAEWLTGKLPRMPLRVSCSIVPLLCLIPLWLTTPYDFEQIPCNHPTDLSPMIQRSGNDQGFFPSTTLLEHLALLPSGDKATYLFPYAIAAQWGLGHMTLYETNDAEAIAAQMRQANWRYLVTVASADRACHKKIWIMDMSRGYPLASNPLDLGKSPLFSLVDSINDSPYTIYIFRLNEGSGE